MSQLTPLTYEIERLVEEHSDLPADYLSYLRDIGWGTAPSGHVIYSGPITRVEVYPQLINERNRIFIGDDMQGFCLGYDFVANTYGEYSDDAVWKYFGDNFNLAAHLADAG